MAALGMVLADAYRHVGPTYYGNAKDTNIDHVALPKEAMAALTYMYADEKRMAEVQPIAVLAKRDHCPLAWGMHHT
eukprot:1918811-Lingulodinium_polyedra.AAC.1